MATNAAVAMNYQRAQSLHRADVGQLLVSNIRRYRTVTREASAEPVERDLGLRAGIRITFTPGKRQELPPRIVALVENIKAFEALPLGWDSYGAHPLNDSAVRAAMALIVRSESTCSTPDRVVPLSNGGLGLRWRKEAAELEIDVDPDGTYEGIIEVGDRDEELPHGSLIDRAIGFVTQYRHVR